MSPKVPKVPRVSPSRKIAALGLLAGYATVLNMLEAPLPRVLPWAKPGLANSAALLALMLYGLPSALTVATIRILLSGLLLGHLGSPSWWMGSAGALGAPVVMAGVLRLAPPLGLISVSAAGAAASNSLQLAVASWVLIDHRGLLAALPLLVATSVPAGLVVGWLTHAARARLPAWVGSLDGTGRARPRVAG